MSSYPGTFGGIYPFAGGNQKIRRYNRPYADTPAAPSFNPAPVGGSENLSSPPMSYPFAPTPSATPSDEDFNREFRHQTTLTNARRNGRIDPVPAPNVYIGGGKGGGATVLPPGANVFTAPGSANQKPANPTDAGTLYHTFRGGHVIDKIVPNPNYRSNEAAGPNNQPNIVIKGTEYDMSSQDALKGVNERMSGPSQPFAPQSPQPAGSPQGGNASAGWPGLIPWLHSLIMGGGSPAAPQQSPMRLDPNTGHYAPATPNVPIDPSHFNKQGFYQAPSIGHPVIDPQSGKKLGDADRAPIYGAAPFLEHPGVRTPVSMLGPSNGLDPATNSGTGPMTVAGHQGPSGATPSPFARQSGPGPSLPGVPTYEQMYPFMPTPAAYGNYEPLPGRTREGTLASAFSNPMPVTGGSAYADQLDRPAAQPTQQPQAKPQTQARATTRPGQQATAKPIATAPAQPAQAAQPQGMDWSRYGGPTLPQQAMGGPVRIVSDQDYHALPSGAEFISPDGVHRRKP